MFAACLALTLLVAQQPQKPPEATATLRGHVSAGDTGQSLRKAQVRLTFNPLPNDPSTPAENRSRAATTDADGRYEFTGLTAGRYTLFVSKSGYVGQAWGQD